MKSILDKDFVYTRAIDTDIRKTFERIRKAAPQEPVRSREAPAVVAGPTVAAPISNVAPIKKARKA